MTPQEREAIYDAEIAPALANLAARCSQLGMSFIAFAEWDQAERAGGTTCMVQEDASAGAHLAYFGARANGNADKLIASIMKYAREHGHQSVFIKVLERSGNE